MSQNRRAHSQKKKKSKIKQKLVRYYKKIIVIWNHVIFNLVTIQPCAKFCAEAYLKERVAVPKRFPSKETQAGLGSFHAWQLVLSHAGICRGGENSP